MLIESRIQGFPIAAIESPGPEFEKNELLGDIISICGGTLLNDKNGIETVLEFNQDYFGYCKSIQIHKDTFVIQSHDDDKKSTEKLEERLKYIDSKMQETKGQKYFDEFYSMRKSKLKNGMAVVYVGGLTPIEVEEKRLRVDNQPYGNLIKAVKENMFKVHPYRWTTIGEMEHLDAATLEEFQAFNKKFYIPNNAVLVVAGDFAALGTPK